MGIYQLNVAAHNSESSDLFTGMQHFGARGGNLLTRPTSPLEIQQGKEASELYQSATLPLPTSPFPDSEVEPVLAETVGTPRNKRSAAPLVNWEELNDAPLDCFDPVKGVFKAKTTGDYLVVATIGLFSPYLLPNVSIIPYFILLKNNSLNQSEILQTSFVRADLIKNADFSTLPPVDRPIFNLPESTQTSISVITKLKVGDTLRIYFVDNFGFPTLAGSQTNPPPPFGAYSVTPLTVTFNLYLLGRLIL